MNQKKTALELAGSYVGYLEQKTNLTIFGKEYGLDGQPWCHMFVSRILDRSGLEKNVAFPYTASCGIGVAWFKKAGRFIPDAIPDPGDIIYFKDKSGKPVHVGLVRDVRFGTITTIEGNTNPAPADRPDDLEPNGGGVWNKYYSFHSGVIYGYGRPLYKDMEAESMTDLELNSWYQRVNPKYQTVGEIPDPWLRDAVKKLILIGVINGGAAPVKDGEDLDARPVNLRHDTLVAIVAAYRR